MPASTVTVRDAGSSDEVVVREDVGGSGVARGHLRVRQLAVAGVVYEHDVVGGRLHAARADVHAVPLRAEGEAEAGPPAPAAIYINDVRSRPGVAMPPGAPATKNDALKAVMHERAVELGAEEVASIDILRWRKKGYFPSLRPDPVPGQVDMFPIPSSETSTNPMIK